MGGNASASDLQILDLLDGAGEVTSPPLSSVRAAVSSC